MTIFTAAAIAVLVGSLVVEQAQGAHFQAVKKNANNYYPNHLKIKTRGQTSESVFNGVPPPHCILAVGFKMPNAAPISLTNWWCNHRHGICIRGLQLRYILLWSFLCFIYDAHCNLDLDLLFRSGFEATGYMWLYEACDNKWLNLGKNVIVLICSLRTRTNDDIIEAA